MSLKYKFNAKSDLYTAFSEIILCDLSHIKKWRKIAIKGKDPEGVHQIRVSLRRLRTALIIFRPILNHPSTQRLAKKLKKYATTLDSARDMDVFITSYLTDEHLDPILSEQAIQQRKKAYKKVRELLKSSNFKALRRLSKKWLKKTAGPMLTANNMALSTFAAQTLEQLRQQVIQQAESLNLTDEKNLHQLRISCKKLRYACEFFSPLYAKKSIKPFKTQLKQLQDCLGTIHDCFVHREMHQILMAQHSTVTNEHALQQQANQISENLKAGLAEQFAAFKATPVSWQNDLI